MKDFTQTIIRRTEALAEKTGFDKLGYFNAPDIAHKNYYVSDERTGLTHILLQDLSIATVDTADYEKYNLGENHWFNMKTRYKNGNGSRPYVTTTLTNVEWFGRYRKQVNVRLAKVVTNTLNMGRSIDIDHQNGLTGDNRSSVNLAIKTHKANCNNRYPYMEVPAIAYPWDEAA